MNKKEAKEITGGLSAPGKMPEGAWFGPKDGSPENTWIWHLGNFFD